MSKRLSFDEKRDRVLKFFHENQRVFNLKELEKLIPKKCGVTQQTVKEVVQTLVDDRLISTDKIGAGNFFWAFLSQAKLSRAAVIDKLQSQLSDLESQSDRLISNREQLLQTRQAPNRPEQLQLYYSLKKQRSDLQSQLDRYSAFDPEVIKEIEEETAVCVSSANRWTDNLYTVRKHCVDTFNIPPAQFDEQFEIKEQDLEDI
ncbi:hypothetical protein P9112_012143 [Eukaryota sp. TZLM1-RC]